MLLVRVNKVWCQLPYHYQTKGQFVIYRNSINTGDNDSDNNNDSNGDNNGNSSNNSDNNNETDSAKKIYI